MKTISLLLVLIALPVCVLQAQDPSWTKHAVNKWPLPGATGVGVHDLDGSGYADAVVAAKETGDRVVWYANPSPPGVTMYWAEHRADSLADGGREVALADVDRDSRVDIVAAIRDEDRIVWYRNSFINPDETWPEYQIGTVLGPRGVFTAFVNGDSLLDVVAGGMDEDVVVWFEAPEDPTSNAWIKHVVDDSLDAVKGVYCLDMNDDALVDIVAAGRGDNDVVWYEHLPMEPVAWRKHFIDENLGGAVSVWCGDLVGDERPEVAVTFTPR